MHDLLLSHFDSPICCGQLCDKEEGVVHTTIGVRSHSDVIHLWAKLNDESTIGLLRYKVYGGSYTIALLSYLCQRLEGQPVQALGELDLEAIRDRFEIPVRQSYGLLLIQQAFNKLLSAI